MKENDRDNAGVRKELIKNKCAISIEQAKRVLDKLADFGFLYTDADGEIYRRT